MTTSNGIERRQHPRFTPGGHYRLRSEEAEEETVKAANQGPGGAFLPVRRALPEGTLLILDVHDPEAVHQGPPVLLIAEVAYCKEAPELGVGVRWKHALCVEGIDRLAQFLESHFSLFLDPKKIGGFHRGQLDGAVQYSFHFGTVKPVADETVEKWRSEKSIYDIQYPQTFLAKADHIETRARVSGSDAALLEEPEPRPEAGHEEVEADETWEPPPVSFADEGTASTPAAATPPSPPAPDESPPGDSVDVTQETTDLSFDDFTQETPSAKVDEQTSRLSDWVSDMRSRARVKVPVLLLTMRDDETFCGVVRNISRNGLFVMVNDIRIFRGERIVVRFPLSLGPISVKLVLVNTVGRVARDRKSGSMGLDLRIDTFDEGGNKGIFDEFIAALRRRVD